MKKSGFTLIEVLIVIIIIGVLAVLSFGSYRYFIEKGKSAEAVVNVGIIKKAEEFRKLDKGNYVAADNTEEINKRLSLDIKPKYYEYQVVGVTDDNFIVIAKRIGEEIEEGKLPPQTIVLAMDKSGVMAGGYEGYLGIGGMGGGSGGGAGGGGFGGGTTGGGGTGSGGGSGTANIVISAPLSQNVEIVDALEKLKDIDAVFSSGDTGAYYYNFLNENNIGVVYASMSSSYLGLWNGSTIEINETLKSDPDWPIESIACIVMHEATHADYQYNVDKWAGRITERWGYSKAQLVDSTGQLYYTITEEYFTNSNEAEAWRELGGPTTYAGAQDKQGVSFENAKLARFEQGESAVRAYLRPLYGLPEFYPGN